MIREEVVARLVELFRDCATLDPTEEEVAAVFARLVESESEDAWQLPPDDALDMASAASALTRNLMGRIQPGTVDEL